MSKALRIAGLVPLVLLSARGEVVSQSHQIPEISEAPISKTTSSHDLPHGLHFTATHQHGWECPTGYNYLPEEYAGSISSRINEDLSEWTIARLLGGASTKGSGYDYERKSVDTGNLGNAVCAKWSLSNITRGDVGCPEGQVTVHPIDIDTYGHKICDTLGEWDIARIGTRGSFEGSGYGCQWRDVDTRDLGNSVCATLNVDDVKVIATEEQNVCGEDSTLITVPEVLNKLEKYCKYVEDIEAGVVRLSGGASLSSAKGDECVINYEDVRPLDLALCARPERDL